MASPALRFDQRPARDAGVLASRANWAITAPLQLGARPPAGTVPGVYVGDHAMPSAQHAGRPKLAPDDRRVQRVHQVAGLVGAT